MSATMVKSGCGCGSGAPSVGKSGCGCGGTCPTCQGQAYTRPLFFSGQLLTEDDLRSLVDYVVGKNRLHNRMLFGDGVVCGLLVTCDPCDCGKVVVQPGYALDCCGNDIVVECPVTLDINKMVHELRTRLLGADCGDPCAKSSMANPTRPVSPNEPPVPPEEKPAQEYCLYVRYCEKPVEPVAPYASDDCSPSSCQNTRLKEGYSFELRCKENDVERPAFLQRVRDCFQHGPGRQGPEIQRDVAITRQILKRTSEYAEQALSEVPIVARSDDRERLKNGLTELQRRVIDIDSEPDRSHLVPILVETAGSAARLENTGEPVRWDDLTQVARELANPKRRQETMSPLARAYVEEHAKYFERYFLSKVRQRGKPAQDEEYLPELPRTEQRAIALEAPFVIGFLIEAQRLLAWLYDRLSSSSGRPELVSCNLDKKLATLGSFEFSRDQAFCEASVVRAKNGFQLIKLYEQRQFDCVCAAVNPNCSSCDDQSILLACFEVRDCCVEEICNLERDFVLTAPNVRYWVPQIDMGFEALEWACCPEACDDDERLEERQEGLKQLLLSARVDAESARSSMLVEPFRPAPWDRFVPGFRGGETATLEARLDEMRRELSSLRERYEELQENLTKKLDDLRGAGAKPKPK